MTEYRVELLFLVERGRIIWITSECSGFERELSSDAATAKWLQLNVEPGDTVTFVRGEQSSVLSCRRTAEEVLAEADLKKSMWQF